MASFKAPADIPGVSDVTKRALQAAFAQIEQALREDAGQYVDRRNPSLSANPQAGQVVHLGKNRRQKLPDPRPYLAKVLTLVVEEGPVTLLGPVNRQAETALTAPGAYPLWSTGDSWWLVVAGSTQGTAGDTGERGLRGLQGEAGQSGIAGPPGGDGAPGDEGSAGPPGPQGQTGPAAPPGAPGNDGADGDSGPPGPKGDKGDRGDPGPPGSDGADGSPGAPGPAGVDGATGATGPSGPMGPPGSDGSDGEPGSPGATGPIGPTGPAGADGSGGSSSQPGPPGSDGEPGEFGPPGQKGDKGDKGDPGPPGSDGADGSDGLPGTAGSTGATGATGATGPAGSAGAGLVASIDVNLGSVPLYSGTFDITGLSGLTLNDPVIVTRGIDPTMPDEAQESVGASGIVISATSIRVQWESINGPIAGTRRFYYAQLTGVIADDFTSVQRADADADNSAALLTALPTYNVSRHRISETHEFTGSTARGIMGSLRPWGSAKIYKLTSEANHPGALRIVIPLGTSGGLCMGDLPNEQLWDPATLLGFRAILNLRTVNPVSDYDVMVGFADDFTLAQNATVSAIGYATANSGGDKFLGITRAASTQTTVVPGSPTITVGNWFLLEAYLTGGVWEFFINGGTKGTSSTNIPTPLMNFGIRIADDTGGSVDFVVDIDTLMPITGTLGQRWT